MIEFAQTLDPSCDKAQCYTIANYLLTNETIAERLHRDHASSDGHLRAARLMVYAGCADEKPWQKDCHFGVFVFEDGSSF